MSLLDQLTISRCSLYQYQIELNPYLPVGKQRIDCRKGLVLEIQLNTQQAAWVEIAPLSGLNIIAK